MIPPVFKTWLRPWYGYAAFFLWCVCAHPHVHVISIIALNCLATTIQRRCMIHLSVSVWGEHVHAFKFLHAS